MPASMLPVGEAREKEDAVVTELIESDDDWREEWPEKGRLEGVMPSALREDALRVNEAGGRVGEMGAAKLSRAFDM